MPGNLLHVNATVTCPHGGSVTVLPAQGRVLVDGRPVAGLADHYSVTGCPYTVAGQPRPCVTVHWESPAGRLQVDGAPVLLQSTVGVCQSADRTPQGAPVVSVVQQRGVGR